MRKGYFKTSVSRDAEKKAEKVTDVYRNALVHPS